MRVFLMRRAHSTRPCLSWAAAALALLPAVGAVGAPAGVDARSPADVYERSRGSLKEVMVHVARDLKVRADTWPVRATTPAGGPGATLVLVVDPTTSLLPELAEMAAALPDVVSEGPRGLQVGVLGASAEWTAPGPASAASGALTVLRMAPLDGPKNLLDAVREAAERLPSPAPCPRAILLVSREGGDGEDDVETTRDLLRERGVAFYSVCREAGFERPWDLDFEPVEVPDLGLTQRWNPLPRRHAKGELFYGCEVAFGLVPCHWELRAAPFAQAEFTWGGTKRFPVPSGFGYYALATLSWSSGGRCFVYNFRAPGARGKSQDPHVELYDLGFLNLFAPDLRPRSDVLKDLEKDPRAKMILKIWELLSDEEAAVILDKPSLEKGSSGLSPRPLMPVRSVLDIEPILETEEHLQTSKEVANEHLKRIEKALDMWKTEVRKDVPPPREPLGRRIEADFDLLGFQLLKMRFHWGEVMAAYSRITPDDVDGRHRTIVLPFPIAMGAVPPKERITLGDPLRETMLKEAMATGRHVTDKYRGTPWALVVEKGGFFSASPHTDDIRPYAPPPREPPSGESEKPPPKPPPPPPPPPKGERPSSAGDGPTTGK